MTAAHAERNGMADRPTRKELSKALATTKRAMNVARDLTRTLRTLESSLSFDYYGRIVWPADEGDAEVLRELRDLLRLARADYPEQRIEINVMVDVSREDTVPAGGTPTER